MNGAEGDGVAAGTSSTPIRGTFASGCAATAGGAAIRPRGRITRNRPRLSHTVVSLKGRLPTIVFPLKPSFVFDDSPPSSIGRAVLSRRGAIEYSLQRCSTTACRQVPVAAMTRLPVVV